MARRCEICGKETHSGRTYTHRGLAKAKGGVGIKITGKTKRKVRANIQKIRTVSDNGTVKRQKVCTGCIRSNRIKKAVR